MKSFFKKRIIHLLIFQMICFFVLVIRLGYLQIYHRAYYQTLSDANRIQTHVILPPRGQILDCNGNIIANIKTRYRGCICAENLQQFKEYKYNLMKLIDIDPEDQLTPYKFRRFRRRPCVIKENLSWFEMAKLEALSPDFPGISIEETTARVYPHNDLFCHVLGYVSSITERDLEENPHYLRLPGLSIGHGGGIEQVYENDLRGNAGWFQEEVDALGRPVRPLDRFEGESGSIIRTHLDKDLQATLLDYLKNNGIMGASIVVMNCNTGAIKALISYPGFDPNLLTNKIPQDLWKKWNKDPLKPMFNKATQGLYAPGSIFKMIVALAALEKQIISPSTEIHCPGYVEAGNKRFHCWAWRCNGHGYVNLKRAIASSCDVYFYQIARKLKCQDISQMAERFGFGKKTGIDLLYEKSGNVTAKNMDTINMSIGQGEILTTVIQLARMMSALANKGYLVNPHTSQSAKIVKKKIFIKEEFLEIINQGTSDVINKEYGTGHQLQFKLLDGSLGMGGKSATTQVAKISMKEREGRKQIEREYFLKDHAAFAAYGPIKSPQYVVIVHVEHGGFGTKTAGPIAQHALKYLLKKDGLL